MSVKAEAENAARKLLADTGWGTRVPVDPARIARSLGLSVVTAHLPQSVSGALVKEPGRDPSILLSAEDGQNRQRFTCAHELGHWVKRSEQLNAYEYVDYRNPTSSTGTDPDERFANAFASALLMPEDAVRAMHRRKSSDIEMSLHFGVSREALRIRLDTLGLK